MKTKFSKQWKSSTQPRKQRKYQYNAPSNIASKFLTVNLSKELREKHGTRNTRIRKGDKIKILRGNFKNKTGTIDKVITKNYKVYVTGIEIQKKDGSKAKVPITISNTQIIELNLEDKRRKNKLTKKTTTKTKETKPKSEDK